jgi:hypothetical protein
VSAGDLDADRRSSSCDEPPSPRPRLDLLPTSLPLPLLLLPLDFLSSAVTSSSDGFTSGGDG